MSQRDSGWIQLYAETNQEALDLHIQAYRLAEELSLPVMVCMDGFILTHAYERVDVPTQEQVDAFLPPFEPRQVLDPADPVTIGAMVGPEAFTEVKYLMHAKQMQALDAIPEIAAEFEDALRARRRAGWCAATAPRTRRRWSSRSARCSGRSRTWSTSCATQGVSIGALGIKCFRPYPLEEVREALAGAERVVVVEKAFAVGVGGIVGPERPARALRASSPSSTTWSPASAAARSPSARCAGCSPTLLEDRLEPADCTSSTWTGTLVERELERAAGEAAAPGPHAENMLRDLGIVAARSH